MFTASRSTALELIFLNVVAKQKKSTLNFENIVTPACMQGAITF